MPIASLDVSNKSGTREWDHFRRGRTKMWQEDLRGGELRRVSAGALTYLNVPPPPLKGPYSALFGASHKPLVDHRVARYAPPAWAYLARAHY